MSEHSDDAFDAEQRRELLLHDLRQTCTQPIKNCDWFRNEEGWLECRHCQRTVDQ